MRLCLAAGRIDEVDRLASVMPDRWLSEWMALDLLDPLEDRRQDLRFGLLAATIAAGHGVQLDPATFALHARDDIQTDDDGDGDGLACDDWRVTKARAEQSIP